MQRFDPFAKWATGQRRDGDGRQAEGGRGRNVVGRPPDREARRLPSRENQAVARKENQGLPRKEMRGAPRRGTPQRRESRKAPSREKREVESPARNQLPNSVDQQRKPSPMYANLPLKDTRLWIREVLSGGIQVLANQYLRLRREVPPNLTIEAWRENPEKNRYLGKSLNDHSVL